MRRLAHVDQRPQLVVLRVHHGDLVGRIRGDEEVAAAGVEAAVVQEPGRRDARDLEVLEVAVVDHVDHPGFLRGHDELGTVVRRDDRRHARLRVELRRLDGHAARRRDLERLQRVAVHDDELRRPVRAGDRVLVLVPLVLGGLDRARLESDLDLGDVVGLRHPQVDEIDLAVAPDHEQVAPGSGDARDVHRVAGLDDVDDLLRSAVDQRDFARVAQRDGHQVLDVVVVHLLLRPLRDGDDDFPARLHLLHAEFGRRGRLLLDVARHQVHLGGGQLAGRAPVRHAGGRAVADEHLEVLGALRQRDVGRERLAGGALAQHAVASRAALEVDLLAALEFGLGHRRRLRIDALVHLLLAQRRAARLVLDLGIRDGLLVLRDGRAARERQRDQREHSRSDSTIHTWLPKVFSRRTTSDPHTLRADELPGPRRCEASPRRRQGFLDGR